MPLLNKTIFILIPFLMGFLFYGKKDNPEKKRISDGQNDGPYVLYKDKQIIIKYIMQKNDIKSMTVDSVSLSDKFKTTLWINTDEPGKKFPVNFKKTIQVESAAYPAVKKLLALSDIEGNFSSFRKLLQANGVIDSNFNWQFGNGHLVLIGDFVDRGEQVTEVLWLIYSLEEKAKTAGGMVHFILGNHEIMNMSNDLRYVNKKYWENTTLLNEKYETLYGENSELGRWLRSKNIIENVGGILFMHGGISANINRLGFSINTINEMARPYYADTTYNYLPPLDTLFSDKGPFWYRGYYFGNKKATAKQVDSTLTLFGTDYIATGHTIVADTISVWFNGKIFNTDVH